MASGIFCKLVGLEMLLLISSKMAPPLLSCNSSDEEENIQRAYAFAKSQRFEEAAQCLRRVVHHFPWIPAFHRDLGRAALRAGKKRLNLAGCRPIGQNRTGSGEDISTHGTSGRDDCSELVCQSIAEGIQAACTSMQIAELLDAGTSSGHSDRCAEVFAKLPCRQSGNGSSQEAAFVLQALAARSGRAGEGLSAAEEVIRAAQDVCSVNSTVLVSNKEVQNGRLDSQTLLAAFVRLEVCGVVELQGPLVAADLLGELALSRHAVPEDAHNDSKVAVQRWEKRFEVQVPLTLPYTDQRLAANSLLLELVRLMLGPRVEIDTFSQITALRDAPDQPWHSDVDLLFKEHTTLSSGHLPPVGLVAVIPLVNITMEMGPTEFMAGSHVFVGEDYWESMQQAHPTSNPTRATPPFLKPVPSLGSVVLFDLRTRHRGTRNQSPQSRSLMYISFVKDWFLDRLNFRGFQSSSFDALSGNAMKKLLRRVDTRTYMSELESFAAGQTMEPPRPAKPFEEPKLTI